MGKAWDSRNTSPNPGLQWREGLEWQLYSKAREELVSKEKEYLQAESGFYATEIKIKILDKFSHTVKASVSFSKKENGKQSKTSENCVSNIK